MTLIYMLQLRIPRCRFVPILTCFKVFVETQPVLNISDLVGIISYHSMVNSGVDGDRYT